MSNSNRVLIFDVETTGLIPKATQAHVPSLTEYPYILQLSFVIYNTFTNIIEDRINCYIKPNPMVIIDQKITELTGITREICDKKGVDITYALDQLYHAYYKCGWVVCHNYDFDTKLVKVEIQRNREELMKQGSPSINMFNDIFELLHNIKRYCTMKHGTKMCNILVERGEGKKPTVKWPRLSELYTHLFTVEPPKNLHNSMVDVLVCMRCYLKMRHNKNILDEEFNRLIASV